MTPRRLTRRRWLSLATALTVGLSPLILRLRSSEALSRQRQRLTLPLPFQGRWQPGAHPHPRPLRRVLVVAPHPDDEVLATGGVIQQHLKQDAQVSVLFLTHGDSQRRKPIVTAQDFLRLGLRRQREGLEALDLLGVPARDVTWLGYPDRGLNRLWNEPDSQYASPHTRAAAVPYAGTLRPEAPYSHRDLLDQLREVLLKVRPQVIYLPHPNDRHRDHWATHAFVAYALEGLRLAGHRHPWAERARLLHYVMHAGRWPLPRGKYLDAALGPPPVLRGLDTDWLETPLEPAQTERKYRAILRHRSQLEFLGKYLVSFARRNEAFGEVPPLTLGEGVAFDATPDLSGLEEPHSAEILSCLEDEDGVGDGNGNGDPFPSIARPGSGVTSIVEPGVLPYSPGFAGPSVASYPDPKRRRLVANLRRHTDLKRVHLRRLPNHLQVEVHFFNGLNRTTEVFMSIKPVCADGDPAPAPLQLRLKRRRWTLHGGRIPIGVRVGEGRGQGRGSRSLSLHVGRGRRMLRWTFPLGWLEGAPSLMVGVELRRGGLTYEKSAYRLIRLASSP